MQSFKERVLECIRAIPPGRVATYGQIAALAGSPGAARQVGTILYGLREHDLQDGAVPWQRVINAQGGISTYRVGSGELQRALLEQEGILFDSKGRCDLEQYRFRPPES